LRRSGKKKYRMKLNLPPKLTAFRVFSPLLFG
jgi:hypothetical protein